MRSLRLMMKEQTPLYIFVAVLFLVGVVFGALIVSALTLDQQQELGDYMGNFFVTVDQQGLPAAPDSYWSIAALNLKWVGLIWILGLSVIGLPGILILDFLKGVLIGFTVGCLVSQYSWRRHAVCPRLGCSAQSCADPGSARMQRSGYCLLAADDPQQGAGEAAYAGDKAFCDVHLIIARNGRTCPGISGFEAW